MSISYVPSATSVRVESDPGADHRHKELTKLLGDILTTLRSIDAKLNPDDPEQDKKRIRLIV